MFPVLISALTYFLKWAMPRIAAFFGIVVLSATVTKPIFEYLQGKVNDQLSSIGDQFVDAVYLIGVPDAVGIVFAAYALALSLKGLKQLGGSS